MTNTRRSKKIRLFLHRVVQRSTLIISRWISRKHRFHFEALGDLFNRCCEWWGTHMNILAFSSTSGFYVSSLLVKFVSDSIVIIINRSLSTSKWLIFLIYTCAEGSPYILYNTTSSQGRSYRSYPSKQCSLSSTRKFPYEFGRGNQWESPQIPILSMCTFSHRVTSSHNNTLLHKETLICSI